MTNIITLQLLMYVSHRSYSDTSLFQMKTKWGGIYLMLNHASSWILEHREEDSDPVDCWMMKRETKSTRCAQSPAAHLPFYFGSPIFSNFPFISFGNIQFSQSLSCFPIAAAQWELENYFTWQGLWMQYWIGTAHSASEAGEYWGKTLLEGHVLGRWQHLHLYKGVRHTQQRKSYEGWHWRPQ